jgi:membrane associated rhomboid family serine protease
MITSSILQEHHRKLPSFGVAVLMALCVSVYALQLASLVLVTSTCVRGVDLASLAQNASVASLLSELQRTLSSNFVHLSPLHLFFNMTTLHGLGIEIEARTGSTRFLFAALSLSICGGLANLLLCTGLQTIAWLPVHSCSAGISGFLFSLMGMQSQKMDSSLSMPLLFGSLHVPVRFYPWALLLIFSFFPGVSFVGHLCGLVLGIAFARGHLRWIEPSDALVDRLDAQMRTRARNFVSKPALPF